MEGEPAGRQLRGAPLGKQSNCELNPETEIDKV